MIQFNNVSKIYGNGHTALNNISFELRKGQMAFLIGHSGAGKTSLLKLIIRMERPSRGQIFLNDKNLDKLSDRQIPYLRRKIGVIFQSPLLLNNRTVFENVALPLQVSGYSFQESQRRARAALEKVGLLSKEKCMPLALSTGEQHRVSIARAVVNKPEILLADEPTGNLDPQLSVEIMRLFEAFNQAGVTVLIATHDLAVVSLLKHSVLQLQNGSLVGKNG
ncbi:MAG: cell division ATP-binding protein FtsE [Proteobacteria bacterium]|nr:cell division ATP-binding protein FtsE [Pseudomonadota bacterium]